MLLFGEDTQMLKNFFEVAFPITVIVAIMVGVMTINAMFWAGLL